MWVAKVKFDGSNSLVGSYAKKYNLSLLGYPISYKILSKKIKIYFVGFIRGEEKNKRNFIKNIKMNRRIGNLEENNNFMIGEMEDSSIFKPMYDYKLLCIEPIIINEKGEELWTMGSWEKKNLIKFIKAIELKTKADLISIAKRKIRNFSIVSTQPNLTPKQKGAMNLAIKNGYYEYPRKTSLVRLSKIFGCSYSTFHNHLRKAEQKLIPDNFREDN